MAHPGPKSDLTEELTLQIRNLVIDGVQYNKIQEMLDIPSSTWDSWVYRNCEDFRVNLTNWKHERFIKKAEKVSDDILDIEHIDETGKMLPDLLRVKQKESEFIRETLAKDFGYSKRSEVTGKNGGALSMTFDSVFNDSTLRQTEGDNKISGQV